MVRSTHRHNSGSCRRVLISAWLVLTILFSGNITLAGQDSPFDPAMSAEAALILEQVDCYTDRSLYICGEPVRFRASVRGTVPTVPGSWSTVLYAELVSPEGERLAQGKYPLRDRTASGELLIPDHILSGTYYLRCYTRWMRNMGQSSFAYVPLRIVNPERSELLEETSAEAGTVRFAGVPEKPVILEFEHHPAFIGREETFRLELLVASETLTDTLRGCLTVVSRSAQPADQIGTEELPGRDSAATFTLRFLPDRHGPSLSGVAVLPEGSGEDHPRARIHFTLMGKERGYFVSRSDTAGRFILGLPALEGNLEFFVQAEVPDSGPAEVRIDQDFDPRQIRMPSVRFSLSEEEVRTATILARNVQLAGIYKGSGTGDKPAADGGSFPFYGSPTRSVDLDQYVLLPTLKEVFLNLVPGVTPVTRRNRTSLQIFSENPSLSLYDALVMVDEVPVLDIEKFLSVSPAKIRQVDVIEDVYVKGDARFGGIINLRSMERDMGGMDLPDHAFFFDYQALHPEARAQQDPGSPGDHRPDTRNTLLWIPDLKVVKGSRQPIAVRAPDYPGTYIVLFRGRDAEGTPFTAETTFQVR
jgi:hypothetical protein